MIVKVCGMRDAANIRQLDEALIADWMGFIFFEKSSRNVTTIPDYLPRNSKRVGVFVNESIKVILERKNSFSLDIIQLHGHESSDYCRELRNELPDDVQIIKMIQVESVEDLQSTANYEGIIDYFLFETKCQSYGGSGKQFDWDILCNYKGATPFLITGGITASDAGKVRTFTHKKFAGIDLNSKFEVAPAMKDITLLKNFINELRS